MTTQPQPLRVLVWLLRALSSRHAADAAVGDVLDELGDRARQGRSPRFPRLWVNAETMGLLMSAAVTAAPRVGRSGWQMLRDAVRSLRRSPAHSVLVIAILAVGPAILVVLILVFYPETAHRELEDLNPSDRPDDAGAD